MLSIFHSAWLLVPAPALGLGLVFVLLLRRNRDIRQFAESCRSRTEARTRGSHKARLQYPDIDLSQCIGCGACVRACPEEGVLALMHGQAVVVHGARCVGHGLCADACPTAGIALTLGDLSERRDLPALEKDLEVVGVPGLFIAGELSGFALVKTAITHGAIVADAVSHYLQRPPEDHTPPLDNGQAAGSHIEFLIIGAGPAGISCALRAKELGLDYRVIDQADTIGGTVASYPQRKLVMTQPVHLPLHGKLPRLTYQKEELIELWEDLVEEHELSVQTGVRVADVKRLTGGTFAVETNQGVISAQVVCLALGRRGSPRKLGIPGEDLPKVAYSLIDAQSYQHRRILVVGGGDSAIEAAVGLAEQEGNEVTLSYRKSDFFRIKARNDARIRKAIAAGIVNVLFQSEPIEITESHVRLKQPSGDATEEVDLPNDEVFVFAGGVPPFGILEKAGVSFDPEDRPDPPAVPERNMALLTAVSALLVSSLAMMLWALWFRSYYGNPVEWRAFEAAHAWLRPAGTVGLSFGILACVMFAWNLAYLFKRSLKLGRFIPGSLKLWMSLHVFTGLFSFLCVLIHAGFTFKNTVGGHAFIALVIVVASGVLGRYFYAFVPRAANGKEENLEELRGRLGSLSAQWDRSNRSYAEAAQAHIDHLVDYGRWRPILVLRIWHLIIGQLRLMRTVRKLRDSSRLVGIPESDVQELVLLTRRAYRLTLQITHYEEIRAILASWRYIHRWLAALLVLLVIAHIVSAVMYAKLDAPDVSAIWRDGP